MKMSTPKVEGPKLATIKQVADFFRLEGEKLADFSAQWKALPDTDKEQIKRGLGDGSLDY